MPMRMSGLISGLDTDTLISQLVSAKKMKVTKKKGEQTKLSWKQDKWKDLNKSLVSLRSMASNLRWSSSWNKKATNVSDSSKASVITGSNAPDSVQTLKITQLAKSGYLTGGQINLDEEGNPTGKTYTALSKLSEFGLEGSTTLNISSNGTTSSVTLNQDSSISDVLTALKNQGLNASFDEKNQRFYISAKSTGADADFSITADGSAGRGLLDKLGISTYDKTAVDNLKSYLSYSEDDIAAEALKRAKDSAESYKTLYNNKKSADKALNDLIEQKSKMTSAEEPPSDEAIEEIDKKIADAQAKADDLASKLADADSSKAWTGTIEYDSDNNIKSISDVTVSDDTNGQNLIQTVRDEFQARATSAREQIDLINNGTLKGTAANKITGQNASINLNGVDYTNGTNVFEINGLTITAMAETKGTEEITLTTSNDTSGIYDQVKKFLTEYNKIINELDKLYNADSASKYTPLTDEEKEALSESEVEKYEQKIKDGLFKSDETISSIMSSLTQGMAQGIKIGDKTLHLSDLGINTLGYFDAEKNETHAFHIDGEESDEKTSGKTNV